MRIIVAILMALAMIFATPAIAEPDNVSKSKVWVDPRVDDYAYLYETLSGQLDPADDITIDVFYTGPAIVKSDTTHVVVFKNWRLSESIQVYADTEWPNQDVALEILSRTEDMYDPINRAMRFIRDVHAWQAEHPL